MDRGVREVERGSESSDCIIIIVLFTEHSD